MAEFDLTKRIMPYLDRHLSLPLLVHLSETDLFPVKDVHVAQYELAKGTNMPDYAANLFSQIYPDQEVPRGTLVFFLPYAVAHVPQNSSKSARTRC
jgi:translation initiation factor 3 subunit E